MNNFVFVIFLLGFGPPLVVLGLVYLFRRWPLQKRQVAALVFYALGTIGMGIFCFSLLKKPGSAGAAGIFLIFWLFATGLGIWEWCRSSRAIARNPAVAREPLKAEPFFWQGVLILLPVAIFAVLGMVFLKRDKDSVEREALENSKLLARQLAEFIGPKMAEQMQERFMQALQMREPNPPEGTHMSETSIWLNDTSKAGERPTFEIPMPQFRRLQASFPPYRHGQLWLTGPVPRFVVGHDGTLLWPVPYPEVPKPLLEGQLNLSVVQRELWNAAHGRSATNAGRKWQELITGSPPPAPKAIAQMAVAQELATGGKKPEAISILSSLAADTSVLTTETGLPLQPLASLDELRLADPKDQPKVRSIAGKLATNALIWPSILSPNLLDEAVRACPGDWPSDAETVRQRWQVDEDTRDLYRELFDPASVEAGGQRTNGFWNRWRGHDWLMLPAPVTATNALDKTVGTGWHALSEELIEISLLELAEQPQARILPYATIVFEVAGKTMGDAPQGQLLAEARLPDWKYVATTVGRFQAAAVIVPDAWVRIYLGKPEALFAMQRQRAWMFGGLIVAALGAALVGWFMARHAFYRQLRLNEMKSNFVSSVSHELRAPIASVRLMAEGLERGKIQGTEKQNEYFRFIVQECRRLSSLIENVLDFSRIEQGRKQYEMESTNLVALVEQTVKLMETYAAERQVSITLQVKGEPMPVEIEGKSMQQALVNLIDNAVKHSPKGASVIVGLDFGVSNVALWVEDKGEGIPAAEHERIFERFYRLGSELRRETQGVGIGLSIVKHIVEAHGGRIIVRSAPGQGSRFTIELPITSAKGAA